jgi:hypothetical protein
VDEHTPVEPRHARPPLLVAVVAAVALEAGLLLGVAGFYAVGLVAGRASDAVAAGATAGLAVLLGLALGFFARALWRGRRWARGPVMTWQLLVLLSLGTTGAWRSPVGAAAVLVALVAGGCLLAPSVVRATTSTAEPPVT